MQALRLECHLDDLDDKVVKYYRETVADNQSQLLPLSGVHWREVLKEIEEDKFADVTTLKRIFITGVSALRVKLRLWYCITG